MKRTLSLLAVGALVLASIACLGASTQEDHRQALIDTREAWVDSIAAGDLERIFSFWTDDVVIYPVSEHAVRGIDAVRKYVRRNRQELGLAPRMTPVEIVASESGDIGYVVGTHVWIDREGRATMPGRYVTLWRKNNRGEWKCFLEIHSPRPYENAPDAGAQGEEQTRPMQPRIPRSVKE